MPGFWPFSRGQKKVPDAEKGYKPSLTSQVGHEVQSHVVDFFSNKRPPQKDPKAPPPSWRNTTVTALSFLVFLYAFIIQIWIISQTIKASTSDTAGAVNGNGSYTSVYPVVLTTSISKPSTKITRDWTSYTSFTTTKGGSTFVTTGSMKTTRTYLAPADALSTSTATGTDGQAVGSLVTATATTPSTTKSSKGKAKTSTASETATDSEEDDDTPDDTVPWLRQKGKRERIRPTITPSPSSAVGHHKRGTLTGNTGYSTIPEHLLRARALTETQAGQNVSASCLFYNGSELPKHGAIAVALNVIYNIWLCVFIILLLSYERKRLRFKRGAHSAAVIGSIQIWLGTDYFSRGVELQLQICAAGIYIIAFLNLMYGLPATHRRGESLFPYLLKRDDDIIGTARSAVVRPGAAKPQEGHLFVRPKDAAEEANLTVLPERNLKPNDAEEDAREQIDIFGTTGRTRPDGTTEDGKKMDNDVRKYVLGGVGAGGSRWYQRDPQEMMWSLLMPPAGANGAGGAAGDGGGGGGSGSSMERILTAMLAMQMIGGMQGGAGGMPGMAGMGGMGGIGGPARGPMMNNPYNPMGQRFPGMSGGAAPGGLGRGLGGMTQEDSELNRYLARAADRRADRAMFGV